MICKSLLAFVFCLLVGDSLGKQTESAVCLGDANTLNGWLATDRVRVSQQEVAPFFKDDVRRIWKSLVDRLRPVGSNCELSESLQETYFSSADNSWDVTQALLGETDGDLQPIVDCAEDTAAAVRLADGLELQVRTPIQIRSSVSFVGDRGGDQGLPSFTCPDNGRILRIRGATGVVLRGLIFSNCAPRRGVSPIEIENAAVTVRDCGFANNTAASGGAISLLAESRLRLRDSAFVNNSALERGGAIRLEAASSIDASGCLFSANTVNPGGDDVVGGGAISAINRDDFVNLTFSGCLFEDNEVDGFGGALYLRGNYLTTIQDCQFNGNFAADEGGAVFVNSSETQIAGESFSEYAVCTVSGSNFQENAARLLGGAIGYYPGTNGSVTSSSFQNNEAGSGGALNLFNNTRVIVDDVQFSSNLAYADGGAVYVAVDRAATLTNLGELPLRVFFEMRNSRCLRNEASNGGCLAAVNETSVLIEDTIIEENDAALNGGGISGVWINTMRLTNVRLRRNHGSAGGAMLLYSPLITETIFFRGVGRANVVVESSSFVLNSARFGGGIYVGDVASLSMIDCNFESNSADSSEGGNGGGLALAAAEGYDSVGSFNFVSGVASGRGIQATTTLRDEAARAVGAAPNPDTQDVVPTTTASLTNVRFTNNTAPDGVGGAIVATSGTLVVAEQAVFEENSAGHVGAVYILQSMFYCNWCSFFNNSAPQSAGALLVHGIRGAGLTGLALAEAYLRNSIFLRNRSGNYGGAIVAEGLNAFMSLMGNVTFERNTARGGGAISFIQAALLNITNTTFINNQASDGGGAIAAMFIQFRDNEILLSDVEFVHNTAPVGGAFQALYNVNTGDEGRPRVEFDGVIVDAVIMMTNVILTENSADEGGAVRFNGVPAGFENVSIHHNSAVMRGGGIEVVGGSVVKVVNGVFVANTAEFGGGLLIDELSMLHCINCLVRDNVAEGDGGGVCVTTRLYDPQPVAFQCDVCDFRNNSASLGGGLYVGYAANSADIDPESDSLVILRGTRFVRNSAHVGGGAIMSAHPSNLLFSCDHTPSIEERGPGDLTIGYLLRNETDDLTNLAEEGKCPNWGRNRVDSGGYGALKASHVSYAIAVYDPVDEENTSESSPEKAILTRTETIPRLPPIRVTLYDDFDQVPSEARIENRNMTVTISPPEASEVELSGQLNAPFVRGEAVLAEVLVRGPPGNYMLKLEFSDGRTESIDIQLEILQCPIGWSAVSENTDCERCEVETYNFDPMAGKCRECPDDGRCRFWAIEPRKSFWLPFPCYENPSECLSEGACDFAGRDEDLEAFFRNTSATCELSEEDLAEFQRIQCNKGHTGLLCGSCLDGHGRRGLECRSCYSRGFVLFLFFCALVWFLIIVSIGIKGNLSSTRIRKRRGPRRPPVESIDAAPQPATSSQAGHTTIELEQRPAVVQNKSVTMPVCPEVAEEAQERVSSQTPLARAPQGTEDRITTQEHAKRTIAETFKLFINFAQVNSMALSINVSWTDGLSATLNSLDFLGVVSGEAAISADCLFSDSSSVPRSISREILFLVFPMMVLALLVTFWYRKLRRAFDVRKRRAILSAVIIFYISYIGLTRRLIRILYCIRITDGSSLDDVFEERYWTEDTAVKCYTGSHAALVGVLVIPMILLVVIAFPVCSAWILVQRKRLGILQDVESRETFGFMFRAYKDEYVFWDGIIMLRKALLALVVGFGYPLGVTLQGAIASFVLFVSVQVQLYLSPFSSNYPVLNHLETFSLAISATTFSAGVFLNEEKLSNGGRVLVAVFVVFLIVSFSLFCITYVYVTFVKWCRHDLEEQGVQLEEVEPCGSLLYKWVSFHTINLVHRFTSPPRRHNQS